MKKLFPLLFAVALVIVAGCGKEKEPQPEQKKPAEKVTEEKVDTPETPEEEVAEEVTPPEEEPIVRTPGQSPFADYPTSSTTAANGDYVIAPSYTWLEDAYREGPENVTFIYYLMNAQEVGTVDSLLKDSFDSDMVYPNTMFIPLPKGKTAAVGDIVLTTWQSGSGMERSIVVEGGTPESPMVLHLDMDYDNPAGIAQETDTLKPNTFYPLTLDDSIEVGKTSACMKDGERVHGIFVNVTGEKVLALEWAGTLVEYNKSDCAAVPPKPTVAVGDTVYFPSFGTYTDGLVTKVDEAIGRVWIEYEWAGEKTEEVASIMDVLKTLP